MSDSPAPTKVTARDRLLDAALRIIREKGYSATTVDDLCAAAGVTKGAFFHHFASKEALAVAAADYWAAVTGALFAAAPYHSRVDPLDRILAYLDFRAALIAGTIPEFTCLVGTMVQEVHESSPAIRDAAFASIASHAAKLEFDLEDAIRLYGAAPGTSARSLALHTQAVLQGGFILTKGSGDPDLTRDSIAHLKRYLRFLFKRPETQEERS
jgi:TetR/AcrR family transcriptional regulator, transcriptional repressor for nem operon